MQMKMKKKLPLSWVQLFGLVNHYKLINLALYSATFVVCFANKEPEKCWTIFNAINAQALILTVHTDYCTWQEPILTVHVFLSLDLFTQVNRMSRFRRVLAIGGKH